MRKSTADLLAGVAFLAVALAFWVQLDAEEGISRIFPLSLIVFITLGGAWCIAKSLWRRTRERGGDSPTGGTSWKRVGSIAVLSVLYGLGIPTLGFFAATGTFLFAAFLALNSRQESLGRKALRALLFAALFSLSIWVGFVKLLNVPTPAGLLF